MLTAAVHIAQPETVNGRQWWRCPCCRRTLAEIVGDRIVVKVAHQTVRLPRVGDVDQPCPRCGAVSVLRGVID
jgi:hypothetical protein